MAKFDNKLRVIREQKYQHVEHIDSVIEYLDEIRSTLDEAVKHYSDKEMLNNHLQPWYSNARDAYENKLDSVTSVLNTLQTKKQEIIGGSKDAGNK